MIEVRLLAQPAGVSLSTRLPRASPSGSAESGEKSVTNSILCSECMVAVQQRDEDGEESMAVCPECGVSDTVENAVAEVGEAAAAQLAEATARGFEAIPRTKGLKVTVKRAPTKHFRFILGPASTAETAD